MKRHTQTVFTFLETVIRRFKEKVRALIQSWREGGASPAQNGRRVPALGESLALASVPVGFPVGEGPAWGFPIIQELIE